MPENKVPERRNSDEKLGLKNGNERYDSKSRMAHKPHCPLSQGLRNMHQCPMGFVTESQGCRVHIRTTQRLRGKQSEIEQSTYSHRELRAGRGTGSWQFCWMMMAQCVEKASAV